MAKKTFGESLIAKGENPNWDISQTADGTIKNCEALDRQDWHWNQSADGPRWNDGFQPKPEMIGIAMPATTRKRRR